MVIVLNSAAAAIASAWKVNPAMNAAAAPATNQAPVSLDTWS
jgi:hypothetical protein